MTMHILFVAKYDVDSFFVSDRLPSPRQFEGYENYPVPVTKGYSLTRLRIEAPSLPILPVGDLTSTQYEDWRSGLVTDSVSEETVEPLIVTRGLGGLCVKVKMAAVDMVKYGTLFEVTVENIGPYSIGKMQVAWYGEWEPSESDSMISRGFHFESLGEPLIPLPNGSSRKFALRKPNLQKGLSYAASLSPDKHYLNVSAALPEQETIHEIYRVTGTELTYMVETLENFLETEEPQ